MIDFLAEGGCSLVEYSKQGLLMQSLSMQNLKMFIFLLEMIVIDHLNGRDILPCILSHFPSYLLLQLRCLKRN